MSARTASRAEKESTIELCVERSDGDLILKELAGSGMIDKRGAFRIAFSGSCFARAFEPLRGTDNSVPANLERGDSAGGAAMGDRMHACAERLGRAREGEPRVKGEPPCAL